MLLVNLLILIFVPFLMLGIIKKTKAFWTGKKGPSVFQPLFDFIKLLKKDFVISKTTSGIFKISPLISITTAFFAALLVPMFKGVAILNVQFGLILFSYTLSLGKFFSLIAAMDTGSSFEGMGASREACFTTIVEPAFFIIMGSLMALSGNFDFESLNKIYLLPEHYGLLIATFTVVALFLMILIECSRVPVDDPATHLELTMIHEVMILDNSASDLALYSWANGIKMLLLSSIIATIVIPDCLSEVLKSLLYFGILGAIPLAIGIIESSVARIRMSHVFEFVFIMSSLALIVLSLVAVKMFGG